MVVTFEGSLLSGFANNCEISSFLTDGRVLSGGRYFRNFLVVQSYCKRFKFFKILAEYPLGWIEGRIGGGGGCGND